MQPAGTTVREDERVVAYEQAADRDDRQRERQRRPDLRQHVVPELLPGVRAVDAGRLVLAPSIPCIAARSTTKKPQKCQLSTNATLYRANRPSAKQDVSEPLDADGFQRRRQAELGIEQVHTRSVP